MTLSAEENKLQDTTFDVVVVGGGAAALTAAVVAGRGGASVALVECAPQLGGTTAKSSGGFWIPNNRVMTERGFEENRDGCIAHMALLAYPEAFDFEAERHGLEQAEWDLITNYFDNAVAAIEDLEASGDLTYMIMESYRGDSLGMPPWFFTAYDGTYGRLLAPTPADDEAEADDEIAVFTAKGVGQDAAATAAAAAGSNATAAVMRARGAIQGDGADLVRQLREAADRYGVNVAVEHRVVDLVLDDDGAVVGVVAETPEGQVTLSARQGVVFGTGGMEHNAELRERFLRGPIVGTCGVSTNRGDFITIVERHGAALANMGEAWWAELPLEPCLESFEQGDLITQIYGDSSIVVDARGERVVNEKILYNERGKAHFVQDEAGGYPNHLLFNVFDEAVVSDKVVWPGRWPTPYASDIPDYVLRADTLDGLADAIQERLAKLSDRIDGFSLQAGFAERLAQTVERFNGFATAGRDEDFQRGETVTDRFFSADSRDEPMSNPTMYPFRDAGPYYCVILGASCLGTKGGPQINVNSQVLRTDGSPIPGLYGAGNCVGSPAGAAYWGGGSTLGPAITHGYLAGMNVVREPVRELASGSPA